MPKLSSCSDFFFLSIHYLFPDFCLVIIWRQFFVYNMLNGRILVRNIQFNMYGYKINHFNSFLAYELVMRFFQHAIVKRWKSSYHFATSTLLSGWHYISMLLYRLRGLWSPTGFMAKYYLNTLRLMQFF